MTYFKLKLVFLFILLFMMSSCIKDNFDLDKLDAEIKYNGNFVFPLAYGDLSLLDIFKLSKTGYGLVETEDGLAIAYRTSLSTGNVNDLIAIANQNISGTLSGNDFKNTTHSSRSSSFKAINMPFTMFNDDARIDSILFKSGEISITLNSTFLEPIEINVKFPYVKKNGESLEFTINLINETQTNNISLSQYVADFTKTDLGYNDITAELTLSYPTTNLTNGEINYNIDITSPKFSIMYGYLGENTLLHQEDNIELTIFKSDKIRIEKYYFEDPKLEIFYKNSYGVPSQISFPKLTASFSNDESDHNLLTEFGLESIIGESNPIEISYPSTVGNTAYDSLKILNHPNSRDKYADISGIIKNKPRWINLILKATTNPGNAFNRNFITENSKIEADVVVELPLYGYLSAYWDSDTIDVKLSDFLEDNNPIEKLVMKLSVTNSFPIEIGTNIKFLDANYNELDVLGENLLTAAEISTDGHVTSPSVKTTLIEYDTDRIEKIKNAKYITYEAHCLTTDANSEKNVRIKKDYKLNFNIGIETVIKLEGNID